MSDIKRRLGHISSATNWTEREENRAEIEAARAADPWPWLENLVAFATAHGSTCYTRWDPPPSHSHKRTQIGDHAPRGEQRWKSPEQIANEVVAGLSFQSNRMWNGRLIGEQYFAAQAIADAVRQERAEIQRLREALFTIQCQQLNYATDKRRSAKTLRERAMETRDSIIETLADQQS